MDAQAKYMFQRNPNEPGSNGSQRPNNDGGNGSGPPKNTMMPLILRTLLIAVGILVIWGLFQYFNQSSNNIPKDLLEVPYSTFYQQVQQDNVHNVVFQGQDATGTFDNAITVPGNNNGLPSKNFHFTQLPNGDPTLIPLLNTHRLRSKTCQRQ